MPPKINKTTKFITDASIVHDGYYNYNKSIFKTVDDKLIIECPAHGDFLQTPYHHVKRGQGCSKCSNNRKLTTEEFIGRSVVLHNNKYDYTKTVYVNYITAVIIKCPVHGEFTQMPSEHLASKECSKCGDQKNSDTQRAKGLQTGGFIELSLKCHGDFYDYSKSVFTTTDNQLIIRCPIHGYFSQIARHHYNGSGCDKCGTERTKDKLRHNTVMFIENSQIVHGKFYNYSKVDYIRARDKVTIICPVHGEFRQTPNSHLSGIDCNKCAIQNRIYTTLEFIRLSNIVHENMYNYDNVKYEFHDIKVEIKCEKHGDFYKRPVDHLSGYGCPKCSNTNYSKISLEWLSLFEEYIYVQHAENDGEYKIVLPTPVDYWQRYILIDGYCPKTNTCFEFDGCLFHGCNECKYSKFDINPINKHTMEFLRKKTSAKHKMIQELGYDLITIKECQFRELKAQGGLNDYVTEILSL